MGKRTDILNLVAAAIGARTYLEIGVRAVRDNFDLIQVADKLGVDPGVSDPRVRHQYSHEFWAGELLSFDGELAQSAGNDGCWDLIFVDGDHSLPQVREDVRQALAHLTPGGVVVMHDCLPRDAAAAAHVKPVGGAPWNGEAWQVYLEYRCTPGYRCWVVDEDHGVGLIRHSREGEQVGWTVMDRQRAAPWLLDAAGRKLAYNVKTWAELQAQLGGWVK